MRFRASTSDPAGKVSSAWQTVTPAFSLVCRGIRSLSLSRLWREGFPVTVDESRQAPSIGRSSPAYSIMRQKVVVSEFPNVFLRIQLRQFPNQLQTEWWLGIAQIAEDLVGSGHNVFAYSRPKRRGVHGVSEGISLRAATKASRASRSTSSSFETFSERAAKRTALSRRTEERGSMSPATT